LTSSPKNATLAIILVPRTALALTEPSLSLLTVARGAAMDFSTTEKFAIIPSTRCAKRIVPVVLILCWSKRMVVAHGAETECWMLLLVRLAIPLLTLIVMLIVNLAWALRYPLVPQRVLVLLAVTACWTLVRSATPQTSSTFALPIAALVSMDT